MITGEFKIRPRYDEVDQMGYVYHSNYVCYCHQARTELLRKYGIHDNYLERNGIMLPVIDFNINYKKPAHYDQLLTVKSTIEEMPKVRFRFNFEVFNEAGSLITTATSTVVFVNKNTGSPIVVPDLISKVLLPHFETVKV